LFALKELGADVTFYGRWMSPIENAAAAGKLDNILTLAEFSGDESKNDVFHWVAGEGSPEMITAVLKAYPGQLNARDSTGKTPLHAAAQLNKPAAVRILVRCGASLEMRDESGNTPLHLAIRYATEEQPGIPAAALELLNLGANIEATNESGYTPLLLAVHIDDEERFLDLVDLGANLHATDKFGRNALHLAAMGSNRVIPVLLEHGFAMDAFDSEGLTPMHYSMARYGSIDLLVSLGGQVDTCDANGRTLLHLTGVPDMMKFLD
jgi:ankyrin repeat protein